jgi:dTDP-4-amino-4,6-dideoxygalactose transaminase
MNVPYVDLAGQHTAIKDELLRAVSSVLDSGKFILGREVQEFEEKFAHLCGARYALGVNSGTDALILALRSLGIGPGDEVITVANSFVSSVSSIVSVGSKPIFVDVGLDANMDPGQIEKAITNKTKAIIPVHWTGRPADMDLICPIARKYGLAVVEDAAQAVCAHYKGSSVGSFGDIGCFSLHPLKTLNACGDGGVLTTNDQQLHEKLRILRDNGFQDREHCVIWSGNSRLDTIQAAMLLVKLKHLNELTRQRRENAQYYQEHLGNIKQVQVPMDRSDIISVYHTFVIQAQQRDQLQVFLSEKGIQTKVHYAIPLHLQPMAKNLGYEKGSLPVTEELAAKILSLPV